MSTRDLGYQAEILAGFYLQAKGYHIVETNWQHGHYELDIVAFDLDQKNWLFVEVKSAQTSDTAMRHFTEGKKQNLAYAIEHYLDEKNTRQYDCQIDLIALGINNQGSLRTIDHIPNVI